MSSLQNSSSAAWTAQQIDLLKTSLAKTNPDWLIRLPLLGDLLNLSIPDNETTTTFTPKLRQETLFALVIEIIQSWGQQQPLLLIIEDAFM